MPSYVVETFKDLILWKYIEELYKETFKDTQSDDVLEQQIIADKKKSFFEEEYRKMQGAHRDWLKLYEENLREDACSYCHSTNQVEKVPLIYGKMCPNVESINFVYACKDCRDKRKETDIDFWQWWHEHFNRRQPDSVLMRKYLKMLYICHECTGTLYKSLPDPYTFEDLLGVWKETCHYKPPKEKHYEVVTVAEKKSSKFLVIFVSGVIIVVSILVFRQWIVSQSIKEIKNFSVKLDKLHRGMKKEEFNSLFEVYKPLRTYREGDKDVIVYPDLSSKEGKEVFVYFKDGVLLDWQKSNK